MIKCNSKTLEHILACNVEITRINDYNVAYSMYTNDPDGNNVELYVDVSDAWKAQPELIAARKLLEL